MTRILILGSDAASARILALALADRGIEVLDAQALEQEERSQQRVFELTCYDRVELRIPELHMLMETTQPAHAHIRSLRQQGNYAQSAKQQSLRAKARR